MKACSSVLNNASASEQDLLGREERMSEKQRGKSTTASTGGMNVEERGGRYAVAEVVEVL